MRQQGPARPLSCGGHTYCQLTAETARREQRVPLGSRERWWRAAPAASSQRGPPRASGSGHGLPPAPNAITVLSDGPAWACPSSSGAGGIHGLPRRAFASVRLRPARRLASRQQPQPPRAALRRPLRGQEDARGRNAPAPKTCANRRRRGRTAHVRPLPAVREGRRAPPAAVMARRVVTGLLLLEAAGLLGALLLYRAMDRSQGAVGRPGVTHTPRRGRGRLPVPP